MPLEQSVSDTNIWSITLELLIMLLVLSFDNQNMFIVQITEVLLPSKPFQPNQILHNKPKILQSGSTLGSALYHK